MANKKGERVRQDDDYKSYLEKAAQKGDKYAKEYLDHWEHRVAYFHYAVKSRDKILIKY